MPSSTTVFRLFISRGAFDLINHANHALSARDFRQQQLAQVLQFMLEKYTKPDPEVVDRFLGQAPFAGNVRLWVRLKPKEVAAADKLQAALSEIAGKPFHLREVFLFLAYALPDYLS